jgi:hypothetical protein
MQTPGPKNMKRIEAYTPWASRQIDAKPNVTRRVCAYMRRVCGRKVTAQYPGRSVSLSERTSLAERRDDGQAEVSRGRSSPTNQDEGPNVKKRRGPKFR